MLHQQPRGDGQAVEVARDDAQFAVGPVVAQGDGAQVAHALHQGEGLVGQHADAQAVVDHAAHGVQPGHLHTQLECFALQGGSALHGHADAAVVVQADNVVVQGCFEINSIIRPQDVGLGHYQHQMVLPVGARRQGVVTRAIGGRVADTDVGGTLADGVDDLVAQVLFQVDLDLGLRPGKSAQVFGQKLHDGRDVGMHPHMATHALGVFAQFALHFFQAKQHRAGVVQQAFASGGEGHTPAVAVQQLGVHGGFQVGQAFADGRRGDEFPLGRLADAAQLTHRHKQLQRGEVEPAGEVAFGGFHRIGVSVEETFRIFH